MAIVDAAGLAPGTTLQGHTCVVGSGPAGLGIALDLARSGQRVLLLESGGFDIDPTATALNEIESTGLPLGTDRLRDRRFGGTVWYGRAVRMDPLDLEPRPWVPSSGWPISYGELEAWYPQAAAFLGLECPDALSPGWWPRSVTLDALRGRGVAPSIHLIAAEKDLARRYRAEVEAAAGMTAVLHATVVGIDPAEDGTRVSALRVAAAPDRTFSVVAHRYVLACGGLENARLLLLLAGDRPGVLGVSEAALGRCYMNHARAEAVGRLHLDERHPSFVAFYRQLTEQSCRQAGAVVQFAAALDEDTQRREGLLNASAFFYPASEARLAALRGPLDTLRDHLSRGRLEAADARRAVRLVAATPLLAGAALARLRRRPYRLDHLVMVDQLEQAPDPASRLVLGTGRDRFGRPLLRVDWRVGPKTLRTHRRFHQLLAERLRDQGVGRFWSRLLSEPDFEPAYEDNAHPMGATRMSADPRAGVVNTDGRVHALDNLYVAGSSVFPTGGHANPTLTIVALALRQAAYLKRAPGPLPGASVQTFEEVRAGEGAAGVSSAQIAARSAGETKR